MSEFCEEFLREKELVKELLILSNVPEIPMLNRQNLPKDVHYLIDVVEVSRKFVNVERAIRFFMGDKIVCKDFDAAIALQNRGFKHIITLDGTQFRRGMISAGKVSDELKQKSRMRTLDNEIKKLVDEV